jgi:uncharacterized OB-fold protein
MIRDPLPDALEPHVVTTTVEFPYRRTLGIVLGEFAAGLREKKLLASRTKSGRVQMPPLEYDPETGESVESTLVDVGPSGTVESWVWVPNPSALHPFSRPFAFALIKVDGTDTGLIHALTAESAEDIKTGMRVKPLWKEDRKGTIRDIEGWEATA